jgi:hypothetical protein
MPRQFIKEAIKHPGALRNTLKVKKGQKIPEAKLNKAAHSKNPTTRKRAVLAKTLRKINSEKKGMSHVPAHAIDAHARRK